MTAQIHDFPRYNERVKLRRGTLVRFANEDPIILPQGLTIYVHRSDWSPIRKRLYTAEAYAPFARGIGGTITEAIYRCIYSRYPMRLQLVK